MAVLEIGVGPNTPVVTSIPATAFASALAAKGGTATYLRVNPDPPKVDKRQGLPSEGVCPTKIPLLDLTLAAARLICSLLRQPYVVLTVKHRTQA